MKHFACGWYKRFRIKEKQKNKKEAAHSSDLFYLVLVKEKLIQLQRLRPRRQLLQQQLLQPLQLLSFQLQPFS